MRSDLRLGLITAALALLAGCGSGSGDARLLVVTSNDVFGKTSPCGCHTPKGGLARRAAFLDSVRAVRPSVLVLDAGGFFPVTDDERDAGPYMLQSMARMGTQAAGVGAGELRFGYAFVREHARAAGVPLVCANLLRFGGEEPAFEASRLLTVGRIRVGVFGLMPEQADLGPARDSLSVRSPEAAARTTIAALRAQGAQLVVLLSQLGRAGTDSLAVHVPGIDLVVAGGGVPVLPSGVSSGGAMALYAGAQGWQVGVADVRFDTRGRLRDIEARTVVLGPEVKNQPAMAAGVKAFEDSLNARLARRDADLGPGARSAAGGDHYLGMSSCIKCHASEYAQWQTTAHARAWRTLVQQQKESTPECVRCHVTGYREPGGFRTADDAVRYGNVQCESCHGPGTRHKRWMEDGNTVPEATCRGCHTGTTSPTFGLASYRPHVLHDPPAGLAPLPETPAHQLMRAGKAPHGR